MIVTELECLCLPSACEIAGILAWQQPRQPSLSLDEGQLAKVCTIQAEQVKCEEQTLPRGDQQRESDIDIAIVLDGIEELRA